MVYSAFSRAFLPGAVLACTLALGACNTASQEVNVMLPSDLISTNAQTSANTQSSIFRALGGAGLNPTVSMFCDNQKVTGDQGYARQVARTYRGYLNKLLAETDGGSASSTGSVYGVDPITGVPVIPDPMATLPPNQDDISVVEKTSLNGKIFNDAQQPVEGAVVTVRSLNDSVDYDVSTTTTAGTYAFNNAPAGVQVEITVTLPGAGTVRRVEVLKSNKQGDPDANRYDFGTDGSSAYGVDYNALSDKPRVTQVTPGRNASGVAADTPVTLVFSEPMKRSTVENNFALCIPDGTSETIVFTQSDFDVSWNADDTAVTFSPKAATRLDSGTHYSIGFKAGDGLIQDKSGVAREQDYFKLTDGNYEASVSFTVAGDFNAQGWQLQQADYQPLPPPVKVRDSFYFSYDDSASTASVDLFKYAMDNYQMPRPEWSKTWEFLNYETFDHQEQESIGLFKASMGLWKYPHLQNPHLDTYEVGIHLSAPYKCKATRQQMNLTILLDVSGSMDEELVSGNPLAVKRSKKELAFDGLKAMASQLKAGDTVNFILFNGSTQIILEDFEVGKGNESQFLAAVAKGLSTGGSTNLQLALDAAYATVEKHYDTRKMNRILLVTDAKANEGNTDMGIVRAAAAPENNRPIYLSGLGLGANHDALRMNQITEAGHGAYYSVNTETDMQEAMGDRFIPLMDAIARNVRFNIEFPGFMRHNKSASEELSRNPVEVQPTTFSANTSQYFWEQFLSNKTDFVGDEKVVLTITYEDPRTRQQKTERLEKSLAEILDKDLQNLKAAHLVGLTTALVRREVSAAEVRQELDQLLPDVGR